MIAFPILAFGVSYVYTHRIPDIYAAKCQILLKSNETYNYQSEIYKGLGFNSKYASYEETASQMRVIKSSNLIENVLDRVSLNVSYYIVGRLKTSEIYHHMPFKVHTDDRSSAYSGMPFNLMIIDTNSFRMTYQMNGVDKDKTFNFDQLIFEDGLYFKVTKEPNLDEVSLSALSQVSYLFKVFKNQSLVNRLKTNIEVANIDYTSIVEITMNDEIADRAVEVLDTLAKLYVQNTVQNQIAVNDNTLEYIDRQLVEVTKIINEIETEIEKYKDQKEILNLSKEEETYYNRLVELETQKRSLDFELKAIDDLTTYLLQNENVETLLPPSIFVNDSDLKLKEQVTQLYTLRSEYGDLSQSGTSSNPRVANLLERIEKLKQDILIYLEIRKNAINVNRRNLVNEIFTYEARIKDIPKSQRQLLNIERRLMVNEELYSFLLSKRAETIIAKAGLVPETRVIENARSVGVIYPDKNRLNSINVLIGLAIGALVVLLRTLFFQKISSLGQLQASTDISILGSIPKKKDFSKTYRILSGSERSDVVQAFRTLRTNLQYFSPTKPCKRVLVTSLLPGEGKTFTAVNLASVLAIAEKRVLLIDFDLHKPRLARAMEMENVVGLSNFLIGAAILKDIIKKTEIPTLDVITSGPVPPNASELIMRDELQEIFNHADEHYDYVLIDTPPISLITDGVMLMDQMDVKLFVLNSKSTSKTSLDYIERLISANSFERCALILNEEKLSRINYYYSRYGYGGYGYGGYGYGYGYGYGGQYGDSGSKETSQK